LTNLNVQKRYKSLIRSAARASLNSDYKLPLGAVIFRGKRILATGWNQNKTHNYASQYMEYPYLHAEVDAILSARYRVDLEGTSIFVVRLLKNGRLAMAKPCPHCQQACNDVGIKRAYWTTDTNYDEALITDMLLAQIP